MTETVAALVAELTAYAKNQHHSFITTQQMAREAAAALTRLGEAEREQDKPDRVSSTETTTLPTVVVKLRRERDEAVARADKAEAALANSTDMLEGCRTGLRKSGVSVVRLEQQLAEAHDTIRLTSAMLVAALKERDEARAMK